MKKFAAAAGIVCAAFWTTGGNAASLTGTVQLDIHGTFKAKVSKGGAVRCFGGVVSTPSTEGGITIGNINSALALMSGGTGKGGTGTVTPTGAGFSCSVAIPYNFPNFVSGQQIVIGYSISGTDSGYVTCGPRGCVRHPGQYSPTSVNQLITLPSVPPNGATTTENIGVKL